MWLSVVKNKLSNNNLRQYLRQPGFTCSACRPFSKTKERVQKFKETGDSQFQNKRDKVCFQHMDILRICSEEQLQIQYYVIKHLILLKIQNMMDINADWLQWFMTFLIKKLLVVSLKIKIC